MASRKVKRRRARRKIVAHIEALLRERDSLIDEPSDFRTTRSIGKSMAVSANWCEITLALNFWMYHSLADAALARVRPEL